MSKILLLASSFLFGLSVTSLAFLQPVITSTWTSPIFGIFSVETFTALCASNVFLGALISALLLNISNINKIHSLYLSCIFYMFSYLIMLYSTGPLSIFLSRLVMGLAGGITNGVVPIILTSNSKYSGIFGSLHSVFICLGLLSGHLIASSITNSMVEEVVEGTVGRMVEGTVGRIAEGTVGRIAEGTVNSTVGRMANGSVSLLSVPSSVPYKSVHPPHQYLPLTVHSIIMGITLLILLHGISLISLKDQKQEKKAKSVFSDSSTWKSLSILAILHISQHMSGVDYIVVYMSQILKGHSHILSSASFIISILISLISGILMDKLGKKKMIILSGLLTSLATFWLATGLLTVVALFLFMVGFNLGLGSVPWFVSVDLFDKKYLDSANTVGTTLNYTFSYLCCFLFSVAYNHLGSKMFLGPGLFMILMVVSMIFLYQNGGTNGVVTEGLVTNGGISGVVGGINNIINNC